MRVCITQWLYVRPKRNRYICSFIKNKKGIPKKRQQKKMKRVHFNWVGRISNDQIEQKNYAEEPFVSEKQQETTIKIE